MNASSAQKSVLLECYMSIASTSIARALRDAGWMVETVIGKHGGISRRHHAIASRHFGKMHHAPPPRKDAPGFQDAVLSLCREGPFDVFLPTTQNGTPALVQIQDKLKEHVHVALPCLDDFEIMHDKALLHAHVKQRNIPSPDYFNAENEQSMNRIKFPVVVKARRHGGGGPGIRYAANAGELHECLEYFNEQHSRYPFVHDFTKPFIQEYVPGFIYNLHGVWANGTLVRGHTILREITYPTHGGLAAVAQSVYDPAFVEWSENVMAGTNWHGPAMVEAIKDLRDGEYKLLEVNPRTWGVIDFDYRMGMNMPDAICRVARGETLEQEIVNEPGKRYLFTLPRLFYSMLGDKKRRWALFKRSWKWWRKGATTAWQPRDLRPNLNELRKMFTTLLFKRRDVIPVDERYYFAND